MFRQRRDQQEAFFGGIFPRKAEPQHRSQRAFRNECSSYPSLRVPFLLATQEIGNNLITRAMVGLLPRLQAT